MDNVKSSGFEDLLRWYPPAWRDRYGDELVVLMEDTYGVDKPPFRARLGLMWSGSIEHVREIGFGAGPAPGDQVRAGCLLVLWAWALFVVAGSGFAKFAEHWDGVTPPGDRGLPAMAYDVVQWSAGIGALFVAVAVVAGLPSLVRLVGDGDWVRVRRPVGRAAAAASVTLLLSIGVVIWGHQMDAQQRNGGSVPYEVLFIVWALMLTATIVTSTGAAVGVARRVDVRRRVLQLQGALALLLALAMILIVCGMLAWWVSVAIDAPRFLSGHPSGPVGSSAPLTMVIVGLLMLAGSVLAITGAGRVARSIRAVAAD